jgi:NitT/TauT family transport system ATP-binding protein
LKIQISDISKSFGATKVLSNISLVVDDNQIISIVGPSGCGKTTLLNILAHLETYETGSVEIQLKDSNPIGYMMQDAQLLPWRTLVENALLGNEIVRNKDSKEIERIDYFFEAFDLTEYKNSYPIIASGGMKQRVALIRTLLIKPSLLLLDEPFSNLDFDIKLKIQKFLLNFYSRNKTTILLVTHDIEDAIALSDKVIVLSDKPTTIKKEIPIDLGISKRDPVEARKSPKFREYFIQIWDELKYLNNDDD